MHSQQRDPVKEVLKRNNHFLSVHDQLVWVTSKHVPVAIMRDEKTISHATDFKQNKGSTEMLSCLQMNLGCYRN